MQTDKAKFKQNFIKRLIALAVRGLKFADILRKNRNLWGPADQFVRSLTSIGANVVEAKSASSKRDYTNYFQIALKSANETKFWLLVIKEYSPDNAKEAQEILNVVIESQRLSAPAFLP